MAASKNEIMKSQPCEHPEKFICRGGNQYGTWTRCNLCKSKLTYVPYSYTNSPRQDSKKKSHDKVISSNAATALEVQASEGIESVLPDDVEQIVTQAVEAETPSMMRSMSRALNRAVWLIANKVGGQSQSGHSSQGSQMPHCPVINPSTVQEDSGWEFLDRAGRDYS